MGRSLSGLSIAAFLLFAAAVLVACGGGGGGGPGAPGVIPAASYSPCPSGYTGSPPNCQQYQAQNSFTPISSATTAPLPSVGGYSGMILVPPAALAGPVQIGVSTSNPTSTSLLRSRMLAHARIAQSSGNTALLYITLTATGSTVTFTGFPGLSLVMPASAGTGPFYLAQLENGVWTTIAGPQSLGSGGTLTFTPALAVLNIAAGQTVYFAVYTGGVVPSTAPSSSPGGQPTSTTSPSPGPTASGSPSSSSSPSAAPTAVGTATVRPSPTAPPSTSPTIPPTPTPTATASPTPLPTASPTPTPSPAPSASPPASFNMGTFPNASWGNAISPESIGFQVLGASGSPISGSYSPAVTVTSTSGAVTLCILGSCSSPTTKVTLHSSSDVLLMSYSGAAISPATISATAGSVNGTATFTPASAGIVYSGPKVSNNPEIDLYAPSGQGTGSTYSFSATQAGYTSPYGGSFSVTGASNCSAFATIAPLTGTSFTVTAIAAPVAGSCTITLNGFSTTLNVKITYTSFGVILQ